MRGRPPRAMPGFAQGLFERAQAAGLDKAILSTVADLRKNLPDSATAYSYLPNLPFSPLSPAREPSQFSTIPSSTAALPNRTFFPPSLRVNSPRPTVAARASMDSDVSIKSLKDAEREIAELRLALLGMGKAMTEWLHAVEPAESPGDDPHADAWRGLGRIRDTLLDAAGQEVDEIVREWAWHDGLEAPSSRATTPGPDTSAPASAPPTEVTKSNVFERSLPIEPPTDVTPTAPAVTIMPSTPRIPAPVTAHQPSKVATPTTARSLPAAGDDPLGSKPTIHLSKRDDRPMAGLSRAPMTAPVSGGFPRTSTWSGSDAPRSPAKLTGSGSVSRDEGTNDPLAGLGVRAAEKPTRRENISRGVDPLLGVGVG
jgi:TBC1 domain family protein 5